MYKFLQHICFSGHCWGFRAPAGFSQSHELSLCSDSVSHPWFSAPISTPWSLCAMNSHEVFSTTHGFLGCTWRSSSKSMGYNFPFPMMSIQTWWNCMHSHNRLSLQKEWTPLSQQHFHSPCSQDSSQNQTGGQHQLVHSCPRRFPVGKSWESVLGKSGQRVMGKQQLWSRRRMSRTAHCRRWQRAEGTSPYTGCCTVCTGPPSTVLLWKAGMPETQGGDWNNIWSLPTGAQLLTVQAVTHHSLPAPGVDTQQEWWEKLGGQLGALPRLVDRLLSVSQLKNKNHQVSSSFQARRDFFLFQIIVRNSGDFRAQQKHWLCTTVWNVCSDAWSQRRNRTLPSGSLQLNTLHSSGEFLCPSGHWLQCIHLPLGVD